MLSDFFRINMPYGIARNDKGEWMAFNREYRPIGFNEKSVRDNPCDGYLDYEIYTSYKGISEKFLTSLADDSTSIHRNESGEIIRVYFYGDGTNPLNNKARANELWTLYFEKIKKIAALHIKY